ncbi:MAG: thermonuclease family protein [Sedimentisphaerales bacterium]|jgi:micrococcal nuclease|nr:thermonuclease family protein [Sedimentisphaerales bacterium]NLT76360.1 hypothetical protein [Planctomycetota bacterium]
MGAVLIGLVVLAWFDRAVVTPQRGSANRSAEQTTAQDLARYHGKAFDVARVVDGDTLDIAAPDGASTTTRVRLLGIDAPETHAPDDRPAHFAMEAAAFARGQLSGRRVNLYLEEDGRTRGHYGRLLAYVALPDGTVLNEVLIAEGYAYADLRFRHGFYHKYRQLEGSARALGKGLWAEATREDLPAWLQRMRPALLAD